MDVDKAIWNVIFLNLVSRPDAFRGLVDDQSRNSIVTVYVEVESCTVA